MLAVNRDAATKTSLGNFILKNLMCHIESTLYISLGDGADYANFLGFGGRCHCCLICAH